jgi:6-phosphogluconolactonase
MKISRRVIVLLLFATSLAPLTFTSPTGQPRANHTYLAFVGTYTHDTGSKGIYAYNFDSETGKLTARGLAAETPDPSWIVIHPNGKWAYAANESGKQSTISAFSIDAKAAKLTLLNQLPALGEDPCYLSFDKTGKYLFVANYTAGNVVVFPILLDGKLGTPTSNVKDQGTLGPNKERQEGPHAHWVQPALDNRFVLVSDLGLDEILVFRFDDDKGTLTPNDLPFAKLAPGNGPRHATFSTNGKILYVMSELNPGVTVLSYDSRKGLLKSIQDNSGHTKDNFSGRDDGAEIAMHPDGKWMFTSVRGPDFISVHTFEPGATGKLFLSRSFATGGKEPRHFAIDPTGRFLLAENQNSNSIAVFRINSETGALSQVSIAEGVPSPVCLVFLPAH